MATALAPAPKYPKLQKNVFGNPDSFYSGTNAPIETFYVIATQHRNSGLLDTTNFAAICERLGDICPQSEIDKYQAHQPDGWYIYSASHWMCGWVEYILISPTAPAELLAAGEEILRELAAYPVMDEEALSEAQWQAAGEIWNECSTPTERWGMIHSYSRDEFRPAECRAKWENIENMDLQYRFMESLDLL